MQQKYVVYDKSADQVSEHQTEWLTGPIKTHALSRTLCHLKWRQVTRIVGLSEYTNIVFECYVETSSTVTCSHNLLATVRLRISVIPPSRISFYKLFISR